MSALTLRRRELGGPLLDAARLSPAGLAGLTEREIGALPVQHGNRLRPLGELFAIAPGDPDTLVLQGGDDRLDQLGLGLAVGSIIVEGTVGDRLAEGMAGGAIEVRGDAGRLVGTGMTAGLVRVSGNVGGYCGAALPAGRAGMNGGVVIVGGTVGAHAGERMRRGLIVAAAAAAFAAAEMIGGTIVLAGACGPNPGVGMRRGTLLVGQAPEAIPATFLDDGTHRFGWLELLARELHAFGVGFDATVPRRRWSGCTSGGGRGELLVAASA